MPRIRTVKPDHWNDKALSGISLQAHLLWIGTLNFSDDEGVFENDPLLIRSQIFPRRTDIRTEQIVTWLDQLVKARFIIPFTHDGEGYYITRTFKTHQKIDRPHKSKIPDEVRRMIVEDSTNDRERSSLYCRVEDSKVEERDEESKAQRPDLSNSNLYRQPTIPTVQDVHEQFLRRGGTSEMADKFYLKHNAVGWFMNNSPIKNYVNLIPSYIHNWNKNAGTQQKIHV